MNARVFAKGVGFCEGPTLRSNGELVVVSIDHGCLYKIRDGEVSSFAEVGGRPNGSTEALDGAIYVAQSGQKPDFGPNAGVRLSGGIQRVGGDGSVAWITQDPIYPNDLCFGPDGFLYFTDPTLPREIRDDGRLWRCDVRTGDADLLFSTPWFPNGIAFGPDNLLYVARSAEQRIVRFSLDGLALSKEELFCRMPFGRPDGLVFDVEGNLIVCAIASVEPEGKAGQIQTYDRNGRLLDAFEPGPERRYTNAVLSPDRVLYVTSSDSAEVLAIDWPTAGLPLYPFRGS